MRFVEKRRCCPKGRAEHHPNVNPTFSVQRARTDTIPKQLENLLIGPQIWFAAGLHAAPNMFASVLPTLAAGGLRLAYVHLALVLVGFS